MQGFKSLSPINVATCLLVQDSAEPRDCLQDIARALLKWEQADALETMAARQQGPLAVVTVSVAGGAASTKTTLEVPHSCSVRFLKRAIERASGVSLACMHVRLAVMRMFVAESGHECGLGTTGFLRDWHEQKVVQKGCMLSRLRMHLPLKSAMHKHLLPTQTQA